MTSYLHLIVAQVQKKTKDADAILNIWGRVETCVHLIFHRNICPTRGFFVKKYECSLLLCCPLVMNTSFQLLPITKLRYEFQAQVFNGGRW